MFTLPTATFFLVRTQSGTIYYVDMDKRRIFRSNHKVPLVIVSGWRTEDEKTLRWRDFDTIQIREMAGEYENEPNTQHLSVTYPDATWTLSTSVVDITVLDTENDDLDALIADEMQDPGFALAYQEAQNRADGRMLSEADEIALDKLLNKED